MAAPTDVGMLTNSRPPIIRGVALKLDTYGGSPSRQRFGSSLFSSSKMSFEPAHHSPPPGTVLLRNASADFHRQAIRSLPKLLALI